MFVKGKAKNSRCFKGIKRPVCRYRSQTTDEWIQNFLIQELGSKIWGRRTQNWSNHWRLSTASGSVELWSFFLVPEYKISFTANVPGDHSSSKGRLRKPSNSKGDGHYRPILANLILEAMKALAVAWSDVADTTIQKSFCRASFSE